MTQPKHIINSQRIANLYEVLKSYAPNDDARKDCQHFTNKHQTTDDEIISELVYAICDGIKYGNWPWVVKELRKKG